MNCTQATPANVTDDLIKDIVEKELDKYDNRMGRCKDWSSDATCTFGDMVPKKFTHRPYQVGEIV